MNGYKLGIYEYKSNSKRFSMLPENMKGDNMVPSCAILQLLLGKMTVYDENDLVLLKTKTNYCVLPFMSNNIGQRTDYQDYLMALGVEKCDNESKEIIDNFLRKDNRNCFVYEHVLFELTRALLFLDKSPTESFVHIYRTLEFISYTFPLIYMSKEKDYRGSYDGLKSFLGNNGTGELKFFSRFIDVLFKGEDEYNFTFEIELSTNKFDELSSDLKNAIKEEEKKEYNYYIEDNILKINFRKMQFFLVEIRNKYFHMLAGHGAKDFYGMNYEINDLFRCVNPFFINWIASIYLRIFQHRLETM